MRIAAIDPGSRRSAWIVLDTATMRPVWRGDVPQFGIDDNDRLLALMPTIDADHLAIEYMRPRGMPTSRDEMDTQFWAGRLVQAWRRPWTPIYRTDEKLTLCGDSRARDSNIRRALIDRYPPTGGGKVPQVGTKRDPGPLYGIRRDIWQALAVAVTWAELRQHDLRGQCGGT